jgi:hypothetical protein
MHYLFEESFELVLGPKNENLPEVENDEADDYDDPMNVLIRKQEAAEAEMQVREAEAKMLARTMNLPRPILHLKRTR